MCRGFRRDEVVYATEISSSLLEEMVLCEPAWPEQCVLGKQRVHSDVNTVLRNEKKMIEEYKANERKEFNPTSQNLLGKRRDFCKLRSQTREESTLFQIPSLIPLGVALADIYAAAGGVFVLSFEIYVLMP